MQCPIWRVRRHLGRLVQQVCNEKTHHVFDEILLQRQKAIDRKFKDKLMISGGLMVYRGRVTTQRLICFAVAFPGCRCDGHVAVIPVKFTIGHAWAVE